MRIDPNKFYVVYNPTKDAEMVDVFSRRINSLEVIHLQFKGGLEPEDVYGFYNSKEAAQKDADILWEKHKKLNKTSTYGIYGSNGTFQFKKEFTSPKDLQGYLDEMYAKGKHYAAYKLTEDTNKINKAQLKRFEEKIDTDDSLNVKDLDQLEKLFNILKNKPASEGMILANFFDTFLREFIPNDIWKAMGGTLNNS